MEVGEEVGEEVEEADKVIHQEFLTRIIQFNWQPASYVDASWLAPWLSREQLAAIKSHTDATRTLNRFLLEEPEPLADVPSDAFSDPVLQLLLWIMQKPTLQEPSDDLNPIVLFAGLALHHRRIKQIICGHQQRQLKTAIGDDGYRFALERAQFMVGSLCESLTVEDWHLDAASLAGRDPVSREPDNKDADNRDANSRSLVDRKGVQSGLIDTGLTLLAFATETLPEQAQRRLMYYFHIEQADKLKNHWRCGFHHYVKEADKAQGLRARAQGLLFRIAQELNPQWIPVLV